MVKREQKITLGEMRASGVRGLLIYCTDYKCSHWIRISAEQWSDECAATQGGSRRVIGAG
jgi:hypothetical protein